MPTLVTTVFGLVVIGYVAMSHRLDRWHVTAPLVFTLVGAVAGWQAGLHAEPSLVHNVAEVTLALILFHDAALVRPRQLRSDASLCARLLLVGLPLTVLAGYAVARLLMPGIGTWLALLMAAALAPTDAGLGAATVLSPHVPVRTRRILNVESGLNDGLATPVVLFAIAAAGGTGTGSHGTIGAAVRELAVGVAVGVVVGAGSGRLLSYTRRTTRLAPGLLGIGTLAVPFAGYYGSVELHGNGFVAAFVSGTAFAAGFAAHAARTDTHRDLDDEGPLALTAMGSTALGYVVWSLFGAVAVAHLHSTWQGLLFAVLSLTALRMVPVALALAGSGLRLPTVVFLGWFGPRGLASVVFALIAVEALPTSAELETVIGTMSVTVLLSVVLHGVTAEPGARRYGDWVDRTQPVEELRDSVEPAAGRGRLHRVHAIGTDARD